MMHGLTPKQAKVMTFIRDHIAEEGYSPSVTEIAQHLGHASKSGAHAALMQLRARGFIDWLPYYSHSIYLTHEVGLPTDVNRLLSIYCARTGESRAAVIADAVRLHLDELEQCEVVA